MYMSIRKSILKWKVLVTRILPARSRQRCENYEMKMHVYSNFVVYNVEKYWYFTCIRYICIYRYIFVIPSTYILLHLHQHTRDYYNRSMMIRFEVCFLFDTLFFFLLHISHFLQGLVASRTTLEWWRSLVRTNRSLGSVLPMYTRLVGWIGVGNRIDLSCRSDNRIDRVGRNDVKCDCLGPFTQSLVKV